jgi:hypothetical protein
MGVEVTIIARTGWTVKELWEGIQANPPEGTYDMVSLLIGVNDQYRGLPSDGYREGFPLHAWQGDRIRGRRPEARSRAVHSGLGFHPLCRRPRQRTHRRQIDEFNAVNIEETEAMGAHYVDVTVNSRMGMDDYRTDRLGPPAPVG